MLGRVKQQPGGSCSRLFLVYFYLRHPMGSCTHGGWLKLGNPQGSVDNIPPHSPASPQRPPGISWVGLALLGWAGGANPTETVTNNFIHGFRPDSRSLHWEWVRAPRWAWKLVPAHRHGSTWRGRERPGRHPAPARTQRHRFPSWHAEIQTRGGFSPCSKGVRPGLCCC